MGVKNHYFNMTEARTSASGVVLDHDTFWIVGGEGMYEYLNTTELIKIDSNHKISHCNGIELPFAVFRHRMVQYNSSAIYLIGGYYKAPLLVSEWIIL